MVLVSMVIYCNGEINKGRHELKIIVLPQGDCKAQSHAVTEQHRKGQRVHWRWVR